MMWFANVNSLNKNIWHVLVDTDVDTLHSAIVEYASGC
jgi:hypothetical protein